MNKMTLLVFVCFVGFLILGANEFAFRRIQRQPVLRFVIVCFGILATVVGLLAVDFHIRRLFDAYGWLASFALASTPTAYFLNFLWSKSGTSNRT